MAGEMKICKTCGKLYEGCRTPNPYGTFRWRDVGCSIECAREYMRKVMIARGELPADEADEPSATEHVEVRAWNENIDVKAETDVVEPVEDPAEVQDQEPEQADVSRYFNKRRKK